MYEATSPWCWMWLRRSLSKSLTLAMSWNSSSATSTREPLRSATRCGRSSSAWSAGSGSVRGSSWSLTEIPGAPSESPSPVVRRMLSIVLRIGPCRCA